MSNAEEVTFDAPAKQKRPKRKPVRKPAPRAEPKSTVPFPGLTNTACADACNAAGCAISRRPYCAHPCKGGLQAGDLNNPEALKRQQSARNQLGVKVDKNRFA